MHLRCTRRETSEVHSSRLAAPYCNMCLQHCRAVPRCRHLSWLTLTNGSVSDDTRCAWGAAMVNGQPDVVQCRWAVLPSNLAGRMKPDLEIGRLAPEPQNPEHPASSRPPICSLPLRCTAKFWLLNRASDDRPAAVRALCSSPLHRRRPAHKSAAQIALPPLQRFEAVTQSMQNALRPAGRELAVPCLKSHPDDDDLCQVPAGIPDPQ